MKIKTQKGVTNEKVSPINYRGKKKDSDVKAIEAIISEDCYSNKSLEVNNIKRAEAQSVSTWRILARHRAIISFG
jgi:hypothetical protein